MIKSIRLRNFKGYRDSGIVHWRPLTIFVGPNNAGKSSLLQALLLLRQTAQEGESAEALITSGALVDLGSFHEIIRGGRRAKQREIGIDIQLDEGTAERMFPYRPRPKDREEPIASRLDLTVSFDDALDRIVVSRLRFMSSGDAIIGEVRRAGRGHWSPTMSPEVRDSLKLRMDRIFPAFSLTKPPKGPQRNLFFSEMDRFFAANHLWMQVFSQVRYIGPIRSPVPRYNLRGRTGSYAAGSGGEQLQRLMRAEAREGPEHGDLIQEVDRWISERFKFLRRLRTVAVDEEGAIRSLVGDEIAGFEGINIANMGEGLSQALPIVAEVLSAGTEELLLIEQPELHLHPRAQADLGDLFVDQVRRRRGLQCAIETHSEHLLLRIRRRIAEGVISPADVAVIYVDKTRGESSVRQLHVNRKGFFDEWPDGFFEEGFEEAWHLSEAAAQVPVDDV